MNVYRISIANIDRHTLARRLSSAGLSGTVFPSLGFGAWGAEKGCTAEVATSAISKLLLTVTDLLRERGEECAYMTTDGANPELIYPMANPELIYPMALTADVQGGWRFEAIR